MALLVRITEFATGQSTFGQAQPQPPWPWLQKHGDRSESIPYVNNDHLYGPMGGAGALLSAPFLPSSDVIAVSCYSDNPALGTNVTALGALGWQPSLGTAIAIPGSNAGPIADVPYPNVNPDPDALYLAVQPGQRMLLAGNPIYVNY